MSSPSSMVFISDAFIVCTYLSAIPFDCGYHGDETLCSICHCFMKSLNSTEVYCGPPSDTITLGTPSSAKTAFISWIKILAVVLTTVLWLLYAMVLMVWDGAAMALLVEILSA